jgi:hypothetical protein
MLSRRRFWIGPATLVAACLLITAPASAVGWEATTPVPGAGAAGAGQPSVAGLADDGAAAILYRSGADTYAASREAFGSAWSVKELAALTSGTEDLRLDMNAAGDAVAAWRLSDGSGFVFAAYKPAGGPWEAAQKLDDDTFGSGRLDVAINSSGTAIVGWNAVEAGSPPRLAIRTAMRTKAGAWPATDSYTTANSEENETTGSVYAVGCGGPAVAIDDAGRALVAWSSPYGSLHRSFDEVVVCGVRTSLWGAGTWSPASDLTPRPAIGNDSSSGAPAPDAGLPVASSDSKSGDLTLAFRYSADAFDDVAGQPFVKDGWSTAVFGGNVASGPAGSVETASIGVSGEVAVAAAGSYAAAATWETDGVPITPSYSARIGAGAGGSAFALGTLSTSQLDNPSVAVGDDGRSFFVFEDPLAHAALAWVGSAGVGAPRTILTATTSAPTVAANCHGDGLVAVGSGTGLYYAEYRGGEIGACGSGEEEGSGEESGGGSGGGGDGPGAGSTPPVAVPPRATLGPSGSVVVVKASKSLADGSVEVTISFPGPGRVAFKGTVGKTVVVSRKASVRGAGKAIFKLMPNAAGKRLLERAGKLSVRMAITFTPSAGPGETELRGAAVFKTPRKSGR